MSDPLNATPQLGLPDQILHLLTPRRPGMHLPEKPAEPTEAHAAPGAVFTPTREEHSRNADMQLMSELRNLAELHRAHQASGGSDQES